MLLIPQGTSALAATLGVLLLLQYYDLLTALWPSGGPALAASLVPVAAPPAPQAAALRRGSLQVSRACNYSTIELDRALSYPLPAYWPLPPLPMVMETLPKMCDLCWTRLGEHPNPCELMSRKETWAPDPHVREALLSALLPCALAPEECNFLDVGSNLGVFSLWGWALGARVVAVEPQPDLVAAFQRTIALNCAGAGIELIQGGLTALPPEGSPEAGKGDSAFTRGLPAGAKIQIVNGGDGDGQFMYRQCQLPSLVEPTIFHTNNDGEATLLLADDVLLQRRAWQLVKVDIDGYDADLVVRMLRLVEAGRVDIATFIIELNNCRGTPVCISLINLAHKLG